MKVIAGKFGFIYPLSDAVKAIDKHMLQAEWDCLMLKTIEIKNLKWNDKSLVKEAFMDMFNELTKNNKI